MNVKLLFVIISKFNNAFYLLIFLSFVFGKSLFSQQSNRKLDLLSVEQGLSNVSVYSIFEDKQGFIWIGTQGGLSRYDGYDFVNYYHNSADPSSLRDNFVYSMCEDGNGKIWLGTRKGISLFDKRNNTFENYSIDTDDSNKKLLDFVYDIVKFNNNLWLGTKGGLVCFDIFKKTFQQIELESSVQKDERITRINDLAIDSSGMLWLGTNVGLYAYNTTLNQMVDLDFQRIEINKILNDNHRIWMGTAQGVFSYEKTTKLSRSYELENTPNKGIFAIIKNKNNRILAGTLKGVQVLDELSGKFLPFFENERAISWYQSNRPQAIYESSDNTYWIATFSDGVYHYDPSPHKFRHYTNHPNDPFSLSDNSVYGLYEDKNRDIWVGTSTDLNILDYKTQKFSKFSNTPTGMVWKIYEDRDGDIWVGGRENLILRKKNNTKIYFNSSSPKGKNPGRVSAICQDSNGIMWFGGRDGLYSHKKGSQIFTTFSLPIITPDSLIINHLVNDFSDRLWVSTNYGLYLVDSSRQNVRYFQKSSENKNSLSDNNLSGVLISKNKDIWIASINYGINKYDPKSETFKHYQTNDGLPDDKIWGILQDKQGMIWLSTSKGISRFNPFEKSFSNFDINDGLQSYEYNLSSFHEGRYTGRLYFGGINGFNVFHPDSIRYNKIPPKIVFTSMVYYKGSAAESEQVSIPEVCCKNNLVLPPSTKAIIIKFAALNYKQSTKNRYAYKLVGINENFIDLGTKHEVTFANLNPGSYTLLVKASNNDGYWNENPIFLVFWIEPSWYQTIWFKILLFGLILSSIFILFQYNLSKRLEMEKMRTQIASDLHDEVGSMLSGLAMQSELLLEDDDKNNVSRLENISLISRSVIGKMRDLVWSIDSRRDSFESLINRMEEQAAELLQPLDISYYFEYSDINLSRKLSILIRQQLFLIFNEALTNVVRHSDASEVRIRMGNFGNTFEMSIHDNGQLNVKKPKTSGMGLSNMKMRAEKIGASIDFYQNNGFKVALYSKKL